MFKNKITMIRTKKDVEKHVSDILSNIDSEHEKNLRGYTFARLYHRVKDYDSAKKHLSNFLSVRECHAPSHKLLAEIHSCNGNLEQALQSYKRSLEIDPQQKDVVLKICELYCNLPVDHETARYWADRAEQLFPHHETVFKLRECLVSAEGEPDRKELENLIATELATHPRNVDLRIKLLRLYLDTERVKEAYDHANKIESKKLFPYSADWYYLLADIYEAYQEEFSQTLNSQFYIYFLTALDHLISLLLAEPHSFSQENGKKPSSVDDAAAVLLTFDQVLKKASELDNREGSWGYFVHHIKGQLYFHMVSLLMKRIKMDQGNRKEGFRFVSALALVCYSFKPINLLQEIWYSRMEENQKTFTNFFQQGSLRTSFIGHVIKSLCKEDKGKWLQKIKQDVCLSQVKERIYSRTFVSVIQKEKVLSSFFILDSTFVECSLEFPSDVSLQEYDKAAYKLYADSLHHLVWMQLHQEKDSTLDNLVELFKNLQYSNKNLSKGSCESLCVLDLEAFLQAAVYQTEHMLEQRRSILKVHESPLCFPPNIADSLCTKDQLTWWRAAHGLVTSSITEKFGEQRRTLQQGLEVIRGVGNHGMEVQLVIYLARYFANKADLLKDTNDVKDAVNSKKKIYPSNVSALEFRATHYWNIAIGILEKILSGYSPSVAAVQMFSGCNKILSNDEVKSFHEEAKLYIAVRLMDADKLDEAAKVLEKLSTPFASYYLALILKKLAAQEGSPNIKTALLNKAKLALHDTMDRVKGNVNHPLNKELHVHLEDVEEGLAKECNNDCEETDGYNGSSPNSTFDGESPIASGAGFNVHSTPRPSSFLSRTKFQSPVEDQHSKHIEPSPERLDAQVRALTLNQNALVKSLMLQQKSLLDTNKAIIDGLKQNREAVTAATGAIEKLTKQLEDMHFPKAVQKTLTKKHDHMKEQGDEDEDYNDYDANGFLEYYGDESGDEFRNSGYSYDPSNRIVRDAATAAPLNYVVPPTIPPGAAPGLPYGYQYPTHPVLPTAPVTERPPYYHTTPGQGLPFSEGQQLPQFHFHVASPVIKPMLGNATTSIPQPLPPVSIPPPQAVMQQQPPPPPPQQLPVVSHWGKTVPHAFQIPLPTTGPFVAASHITAASNITPISSMANQSAGLLAVPMTGGISFGQAVKPAPVSTASVNEGQSIFAGLTKTPETVRNDYVTYDSDATGSPDVDGQDLEKEVMGDFKPVIPLPAEVVVETGEENEAVLFEDRAKLYRFMAQEWKERGTGAVKILHHEGSGRVRLLMRRDQVLKVCANHYITSTMEIHALKNGDRAYTWLAQDYADEELRPENFCIKFKTVEVALVFKAAFEKAIKIAKENEEKMNPQTPISSDSLSITQFLKFENKFLSKAGSWTCPTCYVSNSSDKVLCVACETKKPGLGKNVTITSINPTSPVISSSPMMQTTVSPISYTTSPVLPCVSTTCIFAKASPDTTAKTMFGGFTFSTSPLIRESESAEVKEREILVVSTKSKSPQVTKVETTKPSPFSGFTFRMPTPSQPVTPVSSTMSMVSSTDGKTTEPGSVFGSKSAVSKLDFSSLSSTSPAFASSNKEPAEFKGAGTPLFSSTKDSRRVSEGVDGSPDDYVCTAEFKPVIPLPALVDVKTGEENEEKLFGERAKLFRYDAEGKQWKERGIGELKILYLPESKKYRILMRREQVFKICANHYIVPTMKLSPLNSSDKAWMWVAQDYSEGSLTQEQFAVKFKNSDLAQQFAKIFHKCQEKSKSLHTENEKQTPTNNKCVGNKAEFEKIMNGWECPKCKRQNSQSQSCCVGCSTSKSSLVSSSINQKPLSELFKPSPDSWECQACYVRNKAIDLSCVSCSTPKPGQPVKADQTANKFASPGNSQAGQGFADLFKQSTWECTSCHVKNTSDKVICDACKQAKVATTTQATVQSITDKFQFPSTATTSAPSSTFSTFSFGAPNSSEFVFGMRPVTQPSTFSFGLSSVKSQENETGVFTSSFLTTTTTNAASIFGSTAQKPAPSQAATSPVSIPTATPAPLSLFGSGSMGTGFTFGDLESPTKSESNGVEFRFGSPQKHEFNFSGVRPRSPSKTPKSPRSPASPLDAEEESESSDVDNIYFQPVIPLPPKVDVITGEEDEKVLFCQRAKLFRFINNEWKERGVGDIKLLFAEVQNKVRLLMRRDQVFKVCLNHYLTEDIKFEWSGERSLNWAAPNFAENEVKPELLTVRFKTNEIATQFKDAIDNALKLISNKQVASSARETKITATKPSTFSFKSDIPKTEASPSSGFSLASRFGLSQAVTPSKDTTKESPVSGGKSSPFTFSFKDSSNSPFFSQPATFGTSNLQTLFGGKSFTFGINKEKETSDADLEVVYEAKPTPEQVAAAKKLHLPPTFYLYENKPPCEGCRGCEDAIPPVTGERGDNTTIEKNTVKETSNEAPVTSPSTESFPFANASVSTLSFADLSKNSDFSNLVKTTPPSKNIFQGAGTPLFANSNPKGEDEGDDDTVAQGPDIHFEPVIPLPELIDVKTGEEEETAVFVSRAKLFRYDSATKQWKERGIGDIKILKHKEKCRYRIILRRDQIYKIACNHCITPEMTLSPMSTSETAVCWHAIDYSENQPEPSQFAVRFKNKEILKQFRSKFEECKSDLSQRNQTDSNREDAESTITSTTEESLSTVDANSTSTKVSSSEPVSMPPSFTPAPQMPTGNETSQTGSQPPFAPLFTTAPQRPAGSGTLQSGSQPSTFASLFGGAPHRPSGNETSQSATQFSSTESETTEERNSEEEEEEEEEDESDDDLMFEKQVSLEVLDESNNYRSLGLGSLQVIYDDSVFGYRIAVINSQNNYLCDHIIAVQTCLRLDRKKAMWAALDLTFDPPLRRSFRAIFGSVEAAQEFEKIFQEGKEAAIQAEIVEKTDDLLMISPGH